MMMVPRYRRYRRCSHYLNVIVAILVDVVERVRGAIVTATR